MELIKKYRGLKKDVEILVEPINSFYFKIIVKTIDKKNNIHTSDKIELRSDELELINNYIKNRK